MKLNLPQSVSNIKLPKVPVKVTRTHLDKAFTLALMLNSVLAVVGAVLFFLSSWWIFAILFVVGFPLIAGLAFAYRFTKYREPIKKFVLRKIVRVYEGIVHKRAGIIRRVYMMACWCLPSAEWKHITWGYASLSKNGEIVSNLDQQESEKRWYNQLYHFLATGMGNWNTLEGKNVLEVRSGGGAGLSYVAKHLNPDRAVGLETSTTQINYNEENKEKRNIEFIAVENLDNFAEDPNLREMGFDLVLSVQGSQFFSDLENMVQEVDKVLKQGGVFAFTDLRPTEDWGQLERQLERSSMRILRKENITKNVIQAIKLDELEKFSTINRRFGKYLDRALRKIGLVKNNMIMETLQKGSVEAHAYLLHKVPQKNVEWR